MGTITLTDLANNAAQEIGVNDPGEGLSAQQIANALFRVNNMLDNWSLEQVMVPALSIQSFPLTPSVQKYPIGPAQAWNTARPAAIVSAAFTNNTGPGSPVKVCTADEWAAIPDRQSQSWITRFLFYDREIPTGFCYVAPLPFGGSMELTMWAALSQFQDATTPLTLYPGYARPLVLATAMELCPMFDVSPTPQLAANYQDAMARLRTLNAQMLGTAPPAGQTTAASGAPIAPNRGT